MPGAVFWLATFYILIWAFFIGGVIDRYARDRATRAHAFFAACGVFFLRFLRLGVVAWAVYAFLFGVVVGTYSSIFVASPLLYVWRGKKGSRLIKVGMLAKQPGVLQPQTQAASPAPAAS